MAFNIEAINVGHNTSLRCQQINRRHNDIICNIDMILVSYIASQWTLGIGL